MNPSADHMGRCPDCRKLRYTSRAQARRAARRYPGHHLRAYQCGGFWHLGHLSENTLAGRAAASDKARRARAGRGCPTPGRGAHPSREHALRARRDGAGEPVLCVCGYWHLVDPAAPRAGVRP